MSVGQQAGTQSLNTVLLEIFDLPCTQWDHALHPSELSHHTSSASQNTRQISFLICLLLWEEKTKCMKTESSYPVSETDFITMHQSWLNELVNILRQKQVISNKKHSTRYPESGGVKNWVINNQIIIVSNNQAARPWLISWYLVCSLPVGMWIKTSQRFHSCSCTMVEYMHTHVWLCLGGLRESTA